MDMWVYYLDKTQKICRTKNLSKGLSLWRENPWHIETMVGKIRVSTIFFGVTYSNMPGTPFVFETCVFKGSRNAVVGRYKTIHEAKRGHAKIVKELSGK